MLASKLVPLVASAALLVPAATAAAAPAGQHPASAAATCSLSKDGRKLGATYVTALSTTKVSCGKGKGLVKAFNRCRRANGGAAGKCASRVHGFKCRETRRAIKTQFSAKVSCSASKGRRVHFAYTQFT